MDPKGSRIIVYCLLPLIIVYCLLPLMIIHCLSHLKIVNCVLPLLFVTLDNCLLFVTPDNCLLFVTSDNCLLFVSLIIVYYLSPLIFVYCLFPKIIVYCLLLQIFVNPGTIVAVIHSISDWSALGNNYIVCQDIDQNRVFPRYRPRVASMVGSWYGHDTGQDLTLSRYRPGLVLIKILTNTRS